MEITFKRNDLGEHVASTGHFIAYYKGTELWGRGSSGWYITETDGTFRGIKYDSLTEAKYALIRRLNPISEQFSDLLSNRIEKALA